MMNAVSLVESIVVPHTAFQSGLELLQRYLWLSQESGKPSLILLTGDAGTGKSFLFDILSEAKVKKSKFKKYRNKGGLVVPAPVVGMPAKPSPKSMLEEILSMYDDEQRPGTTEGQLRRRVVTLITECKTDVMFLGDIQHIVDRRTAKVWEHTDDVIKKIHDDSKCLFILSGLPRCSAVIAQNEQLATRLRGHIELQRFSWRDPEQRSEYIGCLEGFHREICKHYRLPAISENGWPYRMYCTTGGLMRLLANFLEDLLSVAGEKKQIGLDDFARAHQTFCFRSPSYNSDLRPFDPKFLLVPTEAVLSKVDQIGREPEKGRSDVDGSHRRGRKAS